MHQLAALLRKHLRASGILQSELAARVGMSDSSVSKVLLGKRALFPARAEAWCAALGLSGRTAQELTDTIHLAAATPRVRAIVHTLEQQVRAARQRH